ncbi:hypothetical protein EWM64_g985 [Hericium alpestre]|uniref:AB hydrolase-1 domain-containing protein n=1 Tax=Hericium alpestre TaxID=135208 RepID=A0A4Z0AAN5_9AGAM|nr:hypothetical protein EWM64_g985 [Hericium alpestre]
MSSPSQDTRMSTYTYNVAGLPVHVHYPPSLVSSATFSTGAPVFTAGKPISVLIFLHGRLSRSGHKMMVDTARDAFQFAEDKKQAGQEQREFIVVTFDHRNHGERTVDPFCNEGWTKDPENEKHNERHAIDMYGLQTGTARDVSFVIDFLPAYLFPNDERTVAEWVVSGISLGGHSTWLVLAHGTSLLLP